MRIQHGHLIPLEVHPSSHEAGIGALESAARQGNDPENLVDSQTQDSVAARPAPAHDHRRLAAGIRGASAHQNLKVEHR
jgi:hypothetical protein